MGISLPLGGEGVLSSPRYYSAVRSHQAVETAGFPLLQERKAGPIARIPTVSLIPKQLKEKAIHPSAWKGNSRKSISALLHKITSGAQIGQVFQPRHLSPSTRC
jgi:hypothetical protein